jgi:hypothetical protein
MLGALWAVNGVPTATDTVGELPSEPAKLEPGQDATSGEGSIQGFGHLNRFRQRYQLLMTELDFPAEPFDRAE